jgi:hypothetical protein
MREAGGQPWVGVGAGWPGGKGWSPQLDQVCLSPGGIARPGGLLQPAEPRAGRPDGGTALFTAGGPGPDP